MRIRVLFFVFLMPVSVMAQLSAPGSKSTRFTSYPSSPAVKDPIFFYCNFNGTERATLTAQKPLGTGTYDFSWFRWSDTDKRFSIPLKKDVSATSSTLGSLTAGGYRVRIDSMGIRVDSLTGWIFFDTPPNVLARLDDEKCNRVALDGTAEATTLKYFYNDPVSKNSVTINNEVRFLWTSSPASVIPQPDFNIDPITYIPPLEDVIYKLQVNTLGCSGESSFNYKAIRAFAEFDAEPVEGESPLEVTLNDKSIRGYKYTWDFGDDTVSHLKNPLPHTYYKPGEYYITLFIESELSCTHMADSIKITVTPSDLDIPNVFSPDDDGYNDRFRIYSKSMRFVSMEVFSQSGIKVYGFSGDGDRLKEWDGWDGNINNSGIKARPGVYFYVIRAFGWDDVKYDSKAYRGFVYLYR